MRVAARLLVLGIFLAGTFAAPPAHAGPEGCVSTNPASPETPSKCKYKATQDGGIVGAGTFKVKIVRGKKKITITNAKGNYQAVGVIQAKDKVTTIAVGAGSWVAAGNPCPASPPGGGC